MQKRSFKEELWSICCEQSSKSFKNLPEKKDQSMKIKKCHPPHKRLSIWVYECSKCNSLWQLVFVVVLMVSHFIYVGFTVLMP